MLGVTDEIRKLPLSRLRCDVGHPHCVPEHTRAPVWAIEARDRGTGTIEKVTRSSAGA
jgi:hypothetical protein